MNVNKCVECIYVCICILEILLRVSGVLVALPDLANGYTVCLYILPQDNVDSVGLHLYFCKIAGEEKVT